MILSRLAVREGRTYLICRCDECYSFFKRRADYKSKELCVYCANQKGGKTRSTHGMNNGNSRLHVTWANMKRRCLNPENRKYNIYGGSGVSICSEWLDFKPFYDWAMMNGYEDNLTIDRKDTSGNYEPSNCRFVDVSTQNANKRITDKNKSGYIGVSRHSTGSFIASIQWKRKSVFRKHFNDSLSAACARDQFIIDNELPHTLNFTQKEISEYKSNKCDTPREINTRRYAMPKAILNQMQKEGVAKEFLENNRKLDTVCYQILKMVEEYKRMRTQSTVTFFAKRHGVTGPAMSTYLLDEGVYKKNRHLHIRITPGKECKALERIVPEFKEG